MSPSMITQTSPRPAPLRRNCLLRHSGKSLAAWFTLGGGLLFAGRAYSQAVVQANGLGAQINKMSGEAINSGSTAFGMACYLAAALCFFFGVWAAWQSRQPQNRETGYVGRALAGLALCGLFATSGVWIGKAAVTASGGAATISTTPGMVNFGGVAAGGGANP